LGSAIVGSVGLKIKMMRSILFRSILVMGAIGYEMCAVEGRDKLQLLVGLQFQSLIRRKGRGCTFALSSVRCFNLAVPGS
jgi:hypothetical protein